MSKNVVRQMQEALENLKNKCEQEGHPTDLISDKILIQAINEGILIGKQINTTTMMYLEGASDRLQEAITILKLKE